MPSAEEATEAHPQPGALVGVQVWAKARFTMVKRPPKPATSNTGYFCRIYEGIFILLFLSVSGDRHLNFVFQWSFFP
jgi:hypothetical protein